MGLRLDLAVTCADEAPQARQDALLIRNILSMQRPSLPPRRIWVQLAHLCNQLQPEKVSSAQGICQPATHQYDCSCHGLTADN